MRHIYSTLSKQLCTTGWVNFGYIEAVRIDLMYHKCLIKEHLNCAPDDNAP